MFASADRATGRTKDVQHGPDSQEDDANGSEDADGVGTPMMSRTTPRMIMRSPDPIAGTAWLAGHVGIIWTAQTLVLWKLGTTPPAYPAVTGVVASLGAAEPEQRCRRQSA